MVKNQRTHRDEKILLNVDLSTLYVRMGITVNVPKVVLGVCSSKSGSTNVHGPEIDNLSSNGRDM